ncbi:hypothetical protein BVRB_2g038840 [Beta vulgaris subsp. vulgaris]|nr:hypothetical protein BVRB_2g038840 [Beta vulgaris subsp. vulgaris]
MAEVQILYCLPHLEVFFLCIVLIVYDSTFLLYFPQQQKIQMYGTYGLQYPENCSKKVIHCGRDWFHHI